MHEFARDSDRADGGEAGTSAPPEAITFRDRVEAVLWAAGALGIFYYGDGTRSLPELLFHSQLIERSALSVALGLILVNTAIFLYLAVWLPHVRGDRRPWEIAAPLAIPTATVLGLTAMLAFIRALWPVYRWTSPVVVFVVFMGMLLSSTFLPGGQPDKQRRAKEIEHESLRKRD